MKKHILLHPVAPPSDSPRRSSRVKDAVTVTVPCAHRQETKRRRTVATSPSTSTLTAALSADCNGTSTLKNEDRRQRAELRRLRRHQSELVPPLATGLGEVVPGSIAHAYPARGTLRFAASVRLH